jgi:hypothetical protein
MAHYCKTCSQSTSPQTGRCGCKDTALTTIPTYTCPPGDCPEPPVCDEIFNSRCITYQDAVITDLPFTADMSMQSMIQMLTIYLTNTACATGNCKSTFNLFPSEIGQTYITMGWASSGANSYTLEYKLPSAPTWSTFPNQTNTIATIPNLTPNTTYLVRVASNCISPPSICYSVTLSIKTKA